MSNRGFYQDCKSLAEGVPDIVLSIKVVDDGPYLTFAPKRRHKKEGFVADPYSPPKRIKG